MKLWKRITYSGLLVWGIKSMIVGFIGFEILHYAPQLFFLSWLSGPSLIVGIWGTMLFTVAIFLLYRERIKSNIAKKDWQ